MLTANIRQNQIAHLKSILEQFNQLHKIAYHTRFGVAKGYIRPDIDFFDLEKWGAYFTEGTDKYDSLNRIISIGLSPWTHRGLSSGFPITPVNNEINERKLATYAFYNDLFRDCFGSVELSLFMMSIVNEVIVLDVEQKHDIMFTTMNDHLYKRVIGSNNCGTTRVDMQGVEWPINTAYNNVRLEGINRTYLLAQLFCNNVDRYDTLTQHLNYKPMVNRSICGDLFMNALINGNPSAKSYFHQNVDKFIDYDYLCKYIAEYRFSCGNRLFGSKNGIRVKADVILEILRQCKSRNIMNEIDPRHLSEIFIDTNQIVKFIKLTKEESSLPSINISKIDLDRIGKDIETMLVIFYMVGTRDDYLLAHYEKMVGYRETNIHKILSTWKTCHHLSNDEQRNQMIASLSERFGEFFITHIALTNLISKI